MSARDELDRNRFSVETDDGTTFDAVEWDRVVALLDAIESARAIAENAAHGCTVGSDPVYVLAVAIIDALDSLDSSGPLPADGERE